MERRFRLKNSTDLKRVRRTGKSFAHPLVVLQVVKGKDADHLRIGVIASRTIGSAVKRNYAKRLLREAIRPFLIDIYAGYDLVLVARRAILDTNLTDLQSAIHQLLDRAKLLEGKDDQRTPFKP